MDIQTRKLEFIQEFLKIQNEELLIRLEKLLLSNASTKNNDFKPMTMEEFNEGIDKSIDDSNKERLTASNDLISEIEKWV